jgi:xanthine/CO dehydrogenase XdhC/CoxF family maturation factor
LTTLLFDLVLKPVILGLRSSASGGNTPSAAWIRALMMLFGGRRVEIPLQWDVRLCLAAEVILLLFGMETKACAIMWVALGSQVGEVSLLL